MLELELDESFDSDENNLLPILCSVWDKDSCDSYESTATDVTEESTVNTDHCKDVSNSNGAELKSLNTENNSTEVSCNQISDDKSKTCRFCNASFRREAALLSHLKSHSNILINCEDHDASGSCERKISTYSCSTCKRKFSTKQKLDSHIWSHRKHPFVCEICAFCCEKKEDLDLHRISSHQLDSTYACTKCGKHYTSRRGLKAHCNLSHSSTRSLHTCIKCDKAFNRKGYIIHMRIHDDETPYECQVCGKGFRDGGTLNKHKRIHNGVRPYVCPVCSKAFNQKVILREHVRRVHLKNCQLNENDVYECSLCGIFVSDRDDLCTHIIKHSDDMVVIAK